MLKVHISKLKRTVKHRKQKQKVKKKTKTLNKVDRTRKPEQNDSRRQSYIKNHPKCKWTKLTNQKAQSGLVDEKTKSNFLLSLDNTPELQR